MHLSSIFNEYGVDIRNTKIVRHPLNKLDVRKVYDKGIEMLEAYQSCQSKPVFDGCKYIAVFMGTTGTEAIFIGIYEILGVSEGEEIIGYMPEDYPYPEHFAKENRYYQMRKTDLMEDLANRLVIDWGKSTLSWHQWASNDKAVLSITSKEERPFPGYEPLILTFSELAEYPNAYLDFRFTILRILPKSISPEEAVQIECLYKNKLCTRNDKYGLNRN